MNTAPTSGLDALRTTHWKVVHKTAETTGNVMRDKNAEKKICDKKMDWCE